MQSYWNRQMLVIKEDFDHKMSQLMAENERRLKEILRLQEDRVQLQMAEKADRETMEVALGQLANSEDVKWLAQDHKKLQKSLKPLLESEEML